MNVRKLHPYQLHDPQKGPFLAIRHTHYNTKTGISTTPCRIGREEQIVQEYSNTFKFIINGETHA